jgi:hypothetical protein
MKKFGLSLALCAALSFAVVTAMPTPVEAAKSSKSSKSGKSKGKPAKVTVQKSRTPVSVTYFNNCVESFGWFGVVAAAGCGVVWAVPTMVETLVWRG